MWRYLSLGIVLTAGEYSCIYACTCCSAYHSVAFPCRPNANPLRLRIYPSEAIAFGVYIVDCHLRVCVHILSLGAGVRFSGDTRHFHVFSRRKVHSRKEFGFALNFGAGESWCGCGTDGSPTRLPERSQLPAYDDNSILYVTLQVDSFNISNISAEIHNLGP
jgi:hypothetical protein